MRPAAATDTGGGGGVPHSSWQSPVPYLFGGLAAMLGLIAVALLILVCSYWKVSGYLGSGTADDAAAAAPHDGDSTAPGEAIAVAGAQATKTLPAVFEESVVVIMAGECKPTFLATPIATTRRPALSKDDGSGRTAE